MRAGPLEFRYRFWVICGLFVVCFYITGLAGSQGTGRLILRRFIGTATSSPAARRIVCTVAAVLVLSCAALRTWASAYLGSATVHDPGLRAGEIMADGPFRHVRNPLYIGSMLLGLGFALFASPLGAAVLVSGLGLHFFRLVKREESELEASQGSSYRAYCARVSRFFPSMRPRLPSAGHRPSWKQAFFGESALWALAIVVSASIITLDLSSKWTWIAVIGPYTIVYFFYRRMRHHEPSRSPD